MPGSLIVSRFVKSFAALNGTGTITATRDDIIRSLLTVGYPSRHAAKMHVGVWRARMLHAMATGYLDSSLRTTEYFRNLEQSEKVGVSFLLGEAFTHWFAQEKMKLTHLLHVQGLLSYGITTSASTSAPKKGSSAPNAKSRPDFVGFKGRDTHIFESKGRIRNPSAAVVAKALGQVSTIKRVNGRPPRTRCATFFMLKANGVEGRIVDPPGRSDGFDVTLDPLEAKARAYLFFLEAQPQPTSSFGGNFLGMEIVPEVFYGVDKQIFEAIRELPSGPIERAARDRELSAILEAKELTYSSLRAEGISVGPDGVLLLDKSVRAVRTRRASGPTSP